MVDTPRWGGLRIEPYDPNPKDADLDGIIQEGTAWERPAGTRILDELGREIVAGLTATERNPLHRIVDADGNTVDYTPKPIEAITDGGRTSTVLGRVGHPSLLERGYRPIVEGNAAAYAESLRPYSERLPADASDAMRWYFSKQEQYIQALRDNNADPQLIKLQERDLAEKFANPNKYHFSKGVVDRQIAPNAPSLAYRLERGADAALGGFDAIAVRRSSLEKPDAAPSSIIPDTGVERTIAEAARQERLVDSVMPDLPYTPGDIADSELAAQRLAEIRPQDESRARTVLMSTLGANYAGGPDGFDHIRFSSEPLTHDFDDPWWDEPLPEWRHVDMTRRELAEALMDDAGVDSLEGVAQKIVSDGHAELAREWARRADDDIVISYRTPSLLRILETGRIKSQFETGRSHGELDADKRAAAEARQFGVPDDIASALRPIYGHLDVREEGETISKLTGSSYGDREQGIHLVLRPGVRERSTMTHGDSLAAYAPIPVSMADSDVSVDRGLLASTGAMRQHMTAMAFMRTLNRVTKQDDNDPGALERATSVFISAGAEQLGYDTPTTLEELHEQFPSLKRLYFEAQVHGGVSTDDVAYVVIPDADDGYTDDIMRLAAESGIPVLRHSEAKKLGRAEADASAASEPASERPLELTPLNKDGEPLDALNMSDEDLDALHLSPLTKGHREEYLARKARVEATHGPIETPEDARAAVARAFPLLQDHALRLRFRLEFEQGMDALTPRETGWIYGLLGLAEEHPTIANNLISLIHSSADSDENFWAFAAVESRMDGDLMLPRYGFSLQFELLNNDPTVESAADNSLARDITSARRHPRPDPILEEIAERVEYHPYELSLADMLLDPRVPDVEATEFAAMQLAMHEWGHLLDYEARLRDRGLSLDDRQDRTWLMTAYGGTMVQAFKFDPLMSQAELDAQGARFRRRVKETLDAEIAHAEMVGQGQKKHFLIAGNDDQTKYDNLDSATKVVFEEFVRNKLSRYARKNDWETVAELWSIMADDPAAIVNLAETDTERAAIMQVFDWLNGNRDDRHATRPIDVSTHMSIDNTPRALSPAQRVQRAQLDAIATPQRSAIIAWQTQDELRDYVVPDVFEERLRSQTRELREELNNPNLTPERRRTIIDLLDVADNAEESQKFAVRRLRKIEELLKDSTEDEVFQFQRLKQAADNEQSAEAIREHGRRLASARARSRALEQIRDRLLRGEDADLEREFADELETTTATLQAFMLDAVDETHGIGDLATMKTNLRRTLEDQYQSLFDDEYVADDLELVRLKYSMLLRQVQEHLEAYDNQLEEWRRLLRQGGGSMSKEQITRVMFAFAVRMDYSMFLLEDFQKTHPQIDLTDVGSAPTRMNVPQGETTIELLARIMRHQPLDKATVDKLAGTRPRGVERKQAASATIEVKSAETTSLNPDSGRNRLCTGYPARGIVPIGRVRYNLALIARPLEVKHLSWPYATKVNRYWRDGFRLEPYDPDAIDADGDGIVQEGTVWERPVGTRWVDDAGREIARGVDSPLAHPNRRLIDAQGNTVDYTPKGGAASNARSTIATPEPTLVTPGPQPPTVATPPAPEPKPPNSPLGQIGYPTIGEMGVSVVADVVAPPPPDPPKPVKKPAKKAAKKKPDLTRWNGSLFARLSRFSQAQQNAIRNSFRAQAKITIEEATRRSYQLLTNASESVRDRGATWYGRVRGQLEQAAKERRLSVEVMAGVLAATSQRMKWYNAQKRTYPNWDVAMATADLWRENPVFTITAKRLAELTKRDNAQLTKLRTRLAALKQADDSTATRAKIAATRTRIRELEDRIRSGPLGLKVGDRISLHDVVNLDLKQGALIAADLLREDVRLRAGAQVMQIPLAAALRVLATGNIDQLRGPKIRSFADNLLRGGEGEAITIDIWMARILTGIDGIELDRGGGPNAEQRGLFDRSFLDSDGNPVGDFFIYPAFVEIVARITDLWNAQHPEDFYTAAQVQAILWEYALEHGI